MGVGNSISYNTRGASLIQSLCPTINLQKFPVDGVKAKFLRYDESRGEAHALPGGFPPPADAIAPGRISTANSTMIPCITGRDNQLAFIRESIDLVQRKFPEAFRSMSIENYLDICLKKLINDEHVTGNTHMDWESCFPLYGFLEKQGAIFKSWRRRVFMFDADRGSVCYYQLGKTKSGNKLKGEIKVLGDTVAQLFDVNDTAGFMHKERKGIFKAKTGGCCFTVGPPNDKDYDQKRTFYLVADHPEAAKRWVRSFQEFAEYMTRAAPGKRHMTIAQERAAPKVDKKAESKDPPVKAISVGDANGLYAANPVVDSNSSTSPTATSSSNNTPTSNTSTSSSSSAAAAAAAAVVSPFADNPYWSSNLSSWQIPLPTDYAR